MTTGTEPATRPGSRAGSAPDGCLACAPVADHAPRPPSHHAVFRALALDTCPADLEIGFALAFQRTYGLPAVATALHATGKAVSRPRERAKDTGRVMYAVIRHGLAPGSPGHAAVRRLDALHAPHWLGADAARYVIAALIVVPLRWLDRHGRRPACHHERAAAHRLFTEMGELMGVRGLPTSWESTAAWADAFEADHFRYTPEAGRLMAATRTYLAHRLPTALRPLAPLAGAAWAALLDDRLRLATGVSRPPAPVRAAVAAALHLRSRGRRRRAVTGAADGADGADGAVTGAGRAPERRAGSPATRAAG
ncbi:oxygenase MpaB family protein [Allostreptomyces psammosilenae]|uniref:ER-bound oxygenase mpaB/mpaB'/Rubber oxygenase catalytic domain-containing protein n=1 Tax=Allostreptomyces psammosilenae TaxID=1892865 RepID=A0A853A8K1_9ACTN|nr:oxygenase MpaB family protein [Allostreptomyces psammosilenae]NYI06858.1 hypothetical protein [Allostreptomyces psammosilenae]